MKIKTIILVTLLVICCNYLFAQEVETDYEALYKKELARQDSLSVVLQDLRTRQKYLLSITGTDSSKLTKKTNSKIKELESKKTELSKLLYSPAYKKLQDLLKLQKQLESQVASLSSDTASLSSRITDTDSQIAQLSGNVAELESIKDNVSKQLINENASILEKPFSQLTIEELSSIKTKCGRYSTDQKINALLARTEKVLNNKHVYDDAIRGLNSKYNKGELIRISERLTNVKETNPIQLSEINQLRGMLALYEPGMATFKLFIQELNRRREGATTYSSEDLNHDLSSVKKKLQEKIDSEIIQVPYLEKAYNEYLKALNAKPMSHPAIETEILNYSN
ncbi:Uncharacterised protein [Porphyromonas cangingivalis]|uniref:hypothetical protein n=1 Tax=Porphyromonas cangingivalis TaxID=36874 RepID=UPI000D9C2FDD|nr:hypothetical protein [Porphyromonas cangingivalis]SPY34983.1 Uncharacterised protein [Porphyromonas cangingivalis]